MADALISATIQVALETGLSLATNRIGLLFGFKKDLASMTESLDLIRAVLSDAEERQVQDPTVQKWLKNLEGVAFDAENILDELNYHFLRHKVKSRNQLKRKVCFFFSFSNCNIAFRWRMASKVRDIKIKLNNINQEANDLGLVGRLATITTFPAAAAGDTTSRKTDSVAVPIIGRANDKSKIVEMLLHPTKKIISVIPIAGMGGLGKTTLAKSIYNNEKIDGHFDKKIWVCVSKKVQLVELLKLILVELTGENIEVDHRNVIVQKIREQLQEKRYLLVLDDVWNLEYEFWDGLFTTLNGLNPTNGSWCLVTTRLVQLAHTVSKLLMMNVEPYFLGRLSDDDCWSILKEKAIGEEKEPEELKSIRDIVIKRCDGLPLVASVIGGLLCLSAKEEWLSIVQKSLLSGRIKNVEQILKVSFDYLSPASVKKCFAYCSIFPKDTKMKRESLIELWMAEGFLVPGSDNETVMEKTGDKYLGVLLQSSLFQETRDEKDVYYIQETRDEKDVYYKMHDLVHDLAESVSKSKSINLETGVMHNNFQIHYLVVNSALEKNNFENISTSLRTLFLNSDMLSGEMLAKFKNLHVLKLSDVVTMKELPTTIDKLIHLRYLDLSNSQIQALPESLCKLYNLQTLRLIRCRLLEGLPKGMSNLISLRHLHYYTDDASFEMPLEMRRLTCLQRLKFFNVGQEKGRGIEELGCLKNLKGMLVIRNLKLVKGKGEAEKADLIGKKDLFRLELLWRRTNRGVDNSMDFYTLEGSSADREGDNSSDEDVLEGLRPHSNLQELAIESFMGDQFPKWFMDLSGLVDLKLQNCNRCRELPVALGQLPSLQHLMLTRLKSIISIGLSFYGIDNHSSSSSWAAPRITTFFPALKTLFLEDMENLVEWMGAEEEVRSTIGGGGESFEEVLDVFPVLERLTIWDCSKLTTAPSHFANLKKLVIMDNNHVSLLKSILLSKGISTTLSTLRVDGGYGSAVSDIEAAAAELLDNDTTTNFQNLKNVSFRGYPYSTSISGWVCPYLESLNLENCENLSGELPTEDLFKFRSLRELTIKYCPRIVIIPEALPKLTSLQRLIIDGCIELTNLPSKMPKSLRFLQVIHCPNLVSFPLDLQQTPSISWLELRGCPKLKTDMTPKRFDFLTSLEVLLIGPFSDDENASSIYNEFDWSGLQSSSTIRTLFLYGLPHMKSLPHQLQYLTTLTRLELHDFGGIEALPDWIGNLQSLQRLSLFYCEKLRCLPSMDAMTRLTKLTYLGVWDCPLLKERCSPSSDSSERSKIAHISECDF